MYTIEKCFSFGPIHLTFILRWQLHFGISGSTRTESSPNLCASIRSSDKRRLVDARRIEGEQDSCKSSWHANAKPAAFRYFRKVP